MTDVELTKMSSKGQVVIPQQVREKLCLKEGETFAVIGGDDMILLRRVATPSPKDLFEDLHAWGVRFAREKGLSEDGLQPKIKRSRGK